MTSVPAERDRERERVEKERLYCQLKVVPEGIRLILSKSGISALNMRKSLSGSTNAKW